MNKAKKAEMFEALKAKNPFKLKLPCGNTLTVQCGPMGYVIESQDTSNFASVEPNEYPLAAESKYLRFYVGEEAIAPIAKLALALREFDAAKAGGIIFEETVVFNLECENKGDSDEVWKLYTSVNGTLVGSFHGTYDDIFGRLNCLGARMTDENVVSTKFVQQVWKMLS